MKKIILTMVASVALTVVIASSYNGNAKEENESQSLIEENVSLAKVDPPSVSIYENARNQYCRRPANSVGCVVAEGLKCDLGIFCIR